ncbi:MAG TPA: VWA domain-containing protein, partial [Thermoanaerobaculia bacterium]|nr:VWA domain-containing protein [Thermoanaerobaculia bacterium]
MKKVVLVLLLAALTAFVAAQTEPRGPGFRETVEVRVMDLDVVVTDSKGRNVADLSRGDFLVKVDGQPVAIDYFARVDEGTIHAPDLAEASPDRVLEEYRKGTETYLPRHFLIYFDVGHVSPGLRRRALEALRDFVTRLGPSDSARVVLFDRRAKELTPWTPSKETIFEALSKIESGVGMSRLLTEQQTLREIDATGSRSSRAFLARSYAEQERAEVRKMLDDMGTELATLTALPGKKAFLLVSGGFDMQPGYAMSQYALGGISLAAFDVRSVASEVDAIVKRANASDVTFYTVDARGLTAEGSSASNDDPLASRPGVSFIAREDSQTGLRTLAQETGGLALVNSNDLQRGLSRVYEDTSTYYSIGVNVSKLPGTGYRNIRVEVSRPGMVVRARRGFAPRSNAERGRDIAQAVLRSNIEYRGIPVTLRVAPPTKQKKYYGVPISVIIPSSALTFLPQGDSRRASA